MREDHRCVCRRSKRSARSRSVRATSRSWPCRRSARRNARAGGLARAVSKRPCARRPRRTTRRSPRSRPRAASCSKADGEVAQIRAKIREMAGRRAELEGARDRARSVGYDDPRGTFGGSGQDVLGQVIGGILGGMVQRRRARSSPSRQLPGPAAPRRSRFRGARQRPVLAGDLGWRCRWPLGWRRSRRRLAYRRRLLSGFDDRGLLSLMRCRSSGAHETHQTGNGREVAALSPSLRGGRNDGTEALDCIVALLRGETVANKKLSWFELCEARLSVGCYSQPAMEMAVASVRSPAGALAAGRHGAGLLVLSGVDDAPLRRHVANWKIYEETCSRHGHAADRSR